MSKHVGRPTRTQAPAPRRLHAGWYALIVVAVIGVAGWLLWPSLAGKFDHHPAGNVLALRPPWMDFQPASSVSRSASL